MGQLQRRIVISPGPVHVHTSRWQGVPNLHHRSDAFREIVLETELMIREWLNSDSPVYLVTSSGTGAMEAAVANVTRPDSHVCVVSGGKFGDRWAEIADRFGCSVDVLRFADGEAVDVDRVLDQIARLAPEFLAITHVESATGSLLPVGELVSALPEPRPVVILDAIASIGVEEIDMDDWEIDVVVGACQKAFAAPAGLSFISLGERARKLASSCRRELYYFSLKRFEEGRKSGDTPYTPAIHSILLLRDSLRRIQEIGLEDVMERHRESSGAFYKAAGHLGLDVFPARPSSAVQALILPDECQGEDFVEELAENKGVILAGGQGELEGMIIRTGFLGLYGTETLERVVSALAWLIERYGCEADLDSALGELALLPGRQDILKHPLTGI